jgi:hypothetical protein
MDAGGHWAAKKNQKVVNQGGCRSSDTKDRTEVMRTKTISDYPLLIGELLRRSELRKARRQRRSGFFKINRSAQKIK